MTSIQTFLVSPFFYLALAVLAAVIVFVLIRRRGWRVKEIEVGLPPKVKFEPGQKPATSAGPVGGTGTPSGTVGAEAEIHDAVQIGRPLIRVWRGVRARVFRVLQIGGGRIEVGGDASRPEEQPRR